MTAIVYGTASEVYDLLCGLLGTDLPGQVEEAAVPSVDVDEIEARFFAEQPA